MSKCAASKAKFRKDPIYFVLLLNFHDFSTHLCLNTLERDEQEHIFLILLNEQLQNWFFTVHAKSPNWHDSVIRNDFSFSFHKKWNPVRNNRYINSSRSAWRSKQRQLKAYLVISCEEDLNKRRNTHTTKSCAIHTT